MDNKIQILVIEDEPSVGEVVSLYLRRAEYEVVVARNGRDALDVLDFQFPQLIILDLMLPEVDGWEVLQWVRARSNVPIIVLTARREESDRIAGLDMGADDYITKPFSPQELVSRVRAVLRRGRTELPANQLLPLDYADLHIDIGKRIVSRQNRQVELTQKEFELLLLLTRHPRQVFSRNQLLERVWGISDYIDPGTVTVHMRRLREKIETDPSNPHHILTIWGVGYKFEP
jgi:DNA-binding response OmpR family regulator